MYKVPDFFRNSFEHVGETVAKLKAGRVTLGGKSAGGRDIYIIEYGEPNVYERTANYSSALGAGDISYYEKKDHPCLMIIGGTHGGEFEGTAAILNLFALLEDGKDLLGREHTALLEMMKKCHIIFIPCINPDGRCRVPFEGVAGMDHSEFRHYDQGNWADGSLCGWPGCKAVHPIKNVEFLGGYFNDNHINLMHDDFFNPMAEETKILLSWAAEHAPNAIANLHGAADMGYGIYAPGYASKADRELARGFEQRLKKRFTENGVRYLETGCFGDKSEFNLTTALHLACGALSITWESHQGVVGEAGEFPKETVYKDILDAHFMFFEELFKLSLEKYEV